MLSSEADSVFIYSPYMDVHKVMHNEVTFQQDSIYAITSWNYLP